MRIVDILAVQQLLQQSITTRFYCCWSFCSLLNWCRSLFHRSRCRLCRCVSPRWSHGFVTVRVIPLSAVAAGFHCCRSFCSLLNWCRRLFYRSRCRLCRCVSSSWGHGFVAVRVIPLFAVAAGFHCCWCFCSLFNWCRRLFYRSWCRLCRCVSTRWGHGFVTVRVIPLFAVAAGFHCCWSFCSLLNWCRRLFYRSWCRLCRCVSTRWSHGFVTVGVIPLFAVAAGFHCCWSFCSLLNWCRRLFYRSRCRFCRGVSSSWGHGFVAVRVIPLFAVAAGFYRCRCFSSLFDWRGSHLNGGGSWFCNSCSGSDRLITVRVVPLLAIAARFYCCWSFCRLFNWCRSLFYRSWFRSWRSVPFSGSHGFVTIRIVPLEN
uniref:Uncharacterized protein n=1 Tax=Ascaris suum TaxID=6253 RepID=Q95PB1_ASCSU|nr:hypothetical protein [Ascaris suum]